MGVGVDAEDREVPSYCEHRHERRPAADEGPFFAVGRLREEADSISQFHGQEIPHALILIHVIYQILKTIYLKIYVTVIHIRIVPRPAYRVSPQPAC